MNQQSARLFEAMIELQKIALATGLKPIEIAKINGCTCVMELLKNMAAEMEKAQK